MLLKDKHIGKRIYGLDILRAVAIISVMGSHGYAYSQHAVQLKYYMWMTLDGVGLFFVLSGFLIGGILIRSINNDKTSFRDLGYFWARRWFRTLPAYYLVLVLLTGLYLVAHKELPPKIFQYFIFTQNFASAHPLFFGEAWSLSVEEWFYLLIPAGLFIILQLKGNRQKVSLAWILSILVAATCIRIFKAAQRDYIADDTFNEEISKQVITRLDGIMYGVLGAWLSTYKHLQWMQRKNTFFIIGLILLFGSRTAIMFSPFYLNYFYYSLSAIGTLCLLPKLSVMVRGKGVVYRIFTFISIISYSMYLTNHMIVERGIMPKLLSMIHIDPAANVANSAISLALFWMMTIGISWCLYRFWEHPVMQLRDKLKPRLHQHPDASE